MSPPTDGKSPVPRESARELLVVDASAMVSLLIDPGPAGTAIAARLGDSALMAPALLPFEVANVLRRRRNAGFLSPGEATLAHDDLMKLSIEMWPWETLASRAWQLGDNLSSYDAAYVALAEMTDATLVTGDKRIAAAPGVKCAIEVF
jgi:predicted nucleic acid-binding protein